MTVDCVGPILGLAASTSNVYMLDTCISKLSVDIDKTLSMAEIWDALSEEQLIKILTRQELETRGGELPLRIICCWIDGGKANDQLQERLDRFRQLLDFVNLASITEGALLDFIRLDFALTESKSHQ